MTAITKDLVILSEVRGMPNAVEGPLVSKQRHRLS